MNNDLKKPIVGFSCGDLNGIGLEVIIKVLADPKILELCTPIVFANNKVINFYRKRITEEHFNPNNIKDFTKISEKQINIFTCWEEEVNITPGELNDTGGLYAVKSLEAATEALQNGNIQLLVTAPIHKKNVQNADFPFTGHTPYLHKVFSKEPVMLMASDWLKVALVTEHVAIKDVAQHITIASVQNKLDILDKSLRKDFGIAKPKIAVLGLNPHSGDEGLIGKEEKEILLPAISAYRRGTDTIVLGPYSSDAFFAQKHYTQFDAVLAMYHDQGLIPFKSLAAEEGINFTAGLPVVRTSPDHGVAFDIAGKNLADPTSTLRALFMGIDILRNRAEYQMQRSNPLKKMSKQLLANAVDEAMAPEQTDN
jgi:4-phospho-D-threonate 3-dehydrogenase / 4-phospho-D-erythronate 3-dehydrogenase